MAKKGDFSVEVPPTIEETIGVWDDYWMKAQLDYARKLKRSRHKAVASQHDTPFHVKFMSRVRYGIAFVVILSLFYGVNAGAKWVRCQPSIFGGMYAAQRAKDCPEMVNNEYSLGVPVLTPAEVFTPESVLTSTPRPAFIPSGPTPAPVGP